MTQYAGGKSRIGNRIAEVISKYELEQLGHNESPYFEPFVGMGGVLTKMTNKGYSRKYFACDNEKCIVSFWRDIQQGWSPPTITKDEYKSIRLNGIENSTYAFAAFGCSFKGMRWGGFYEEALNIAQRKLNKSNFKELVKDVEFLDSCSYEKHNPNSMVVYCDPPYAKSNFASVRKNLNKFDHDKFWETMRLWSVTNLVIVSEIVAPEDFECIWSYERQNGINKDKPIIEKLFILK